METTKEKNHAITNCVGQLESIKELYRNYKKADTQEDWEAREKIVEKAQEEALSVEFRSGWVTNSEDMKTEEFKILLSTGGPACQIIGKLDHYNQPIDIEIQYQDWYQPWKTLLTSPEKCKIDHQALFWFCECFYFGE